MSMDAMNKINYCLTYHSFLFYISKLLYVTVILYFLYSFSFSPRRRFVFQTEISGKYIVFVLFHCRFISFPLFAVGISLPLLDVTVILYFLYSFSFSPRRRFVFQTEISVKYIVFVLFYCRFISFPLFVGVISLPFLA